MPVINFNPAVGLLLTQLPSILFWPDDMESDDTWLDNVPGDFDRLSNLVTEDLIKPTEALISLLYQSVSIRDSRHSIQLGVSSGYPNTTFATV